MCKESSFNDNRQSLYDKLDKQKNLFVKRRCIFLLYQQVQNDVVTTQEYSILLF